MSRIGLCGKCKHGWIVKSAGAVNVICKACNYITFFPPTPVEECSEFEPKDENENRVEDESN